MDLNQRKLTKEEWAGIEIPLQSDEIRIAKMITKGYHNVMIKENTTMSLLTYLKISYSKEIDLYIYNQYLEPELQKIANKFNFKVFNITKNKNIIKKKDLIRFANTDRNLNQHKENIFEYILINLIGNMYKNMSSNKWLYYYYTIKITKICLIQTKPCQRQNLIQISKNLQSLELEISTILYPCG